MLPEEPHWTFLLFTPVMMNIIMDTQHLQAGSGLNVVSRDGDALLT